MRSLRKRRRSSRQRCRRLTLQLAFIFLTHNPFVWLECQIFLLYASYRTSCNPRDLLNFPWTLWVPGASSWLQIRSSTLLVLTDVLADLGRPLPTFRSALSSCMPSIRLSNLPSPLLDHPLDGNSFNSFFEPHLFFSLFSDFQLRFYHLHLFHPYRRFTHGLTSHMTSYIEYLSNRLFVNNL